LADAVHVNMKELANDASKDLAEFHSAPSHRERELPLVDLCSDSDPDAPARSLTNKLRIRSDALEDDVMPRPVAAATAAGHGVTLHGVAPSEEVSAVQQQRAEALFPNSFKVSGVKHVADNLLGSVLTSLPQFLNSTSANIISSDSDMDMVQVFILCPLCVHVPCDFRLSNLRGCWIQVIR